MSFHNLSISVLKVGRQLAGSLAVAAFFIPSTTGCLKEEDPVTPHNPGNVITRSINLSSDYRFQVFYNLNQDSIFSQNLKTDWDIAFQSSALPNTEGSKVILNPAKFMSAWNTNREDIEKISDTTGFFKNRRWDAANHPDTMSIGDVLGQTKTFWIDRGYDEKGDQLDFVKIKFISVDKQKYVIAVEKKGDKNAQTFEIQKDINRNFSYFSFNTNAQVIIEPNKNDWDLMFTQYIHTFSEPYQPYLVTGVLLNPYNTFAAVDSTIDFNKIDINVAQNMQLRQASDVIGYNWKEYGFTGTIYKIFSHWNYVVRNSKGIYFKLHFIDFYDAQGTKGHPKFEFQKL